jgi:class 3 adenylate cyclase/tetratricopeptide (TPR) repeat protein
VECPSCALENRPGAGFCRGCGASLETVPRRCPSCGGEQPPDAQFCDRCGTRANGPRAASRPTLGARVSARAAERRLVTVLFADARGSTALTEQLGDEEMYRLMQGCVSAMQAAVEKHDGTVTQFRGDGVMALFGAPVAMEQAAVKAVTAALEMRDALHAYGQELRERTGAACAFRIGINTGPVVVGRMGDDTLVDYTAIGDTANVASRLEQAAGDGEVFLSDQTWRAVRNFVDCEEVGPLELKGKQRPVTARRALRRRPVSDRLDAVDEHRLSRFVGRDDELALMVGLAHRLTTDDGAGGRVVAVSGEAGIGKSRLVREVHDRLPAGLAWLEGRSSASDRSTPWHVVVDLLRRAFDVSENHTHDDIIRAIDNQLVNWPDEARSPIPYLRWLLGVPTPELDDVDPQELRVGTVEALVAVLRETAARQPTVVTFEDLHWADEASEAVITRLASAVADMPVLVLVTFRPDRTFDLGERAGVTRLALDGLAHDVVSDLATGTLGAELSEPARRLIVERTGGNPLFVEELAASLLESGAFVLEDGRLDLSPGADATTIPESLHDVVQTRIDRLDEDARGALQLASVIGREFTRRILDRISQMPSGLDGHLIELESLELIRQRSWFPELSYLFKHAVVHDVTYSTLLDERRRALHRLVAEATEELYAHNLAEHAEALSRHWLAAGEDERALPHLSAAAGRALTSLVLSRAIEAFGQAADIAERLGDLPAALALRDQRGHALLAASDVDGVIAEAESIVDLARRVGDPTAESAAMAMRSQAEFWAHDFDAAIEHARLGYALMTRRERIGRLNPAAAGAALGCAVAEALTLTVLGRLDEADEALERAGEHVGPITPRVRAFWLQLEDARGNWRARWRADIPSMDVVDDAFLADRVMILWTAGLHYAGAGDYRAALHELHRALTVCERTGELLARVRILNTIGWIHGELGDDAGGRTFNERSIAEAVPLRLPNREIEANAMLNLVDTALVHGRLNEAQRHLDDLEPTVRHPSPAEAWMLWRYGQRWRCASGELVLASGGDEQRAIQLADECLDIAERTDSPKYTVRARRLRGRALAAAGRATDAVEDLDRSLQLARELGNPPQLWRSLLARAEHPGGAGYADEAIGVMDEVVASLGDHPLAATMRASPERPVAHGTGR